MRVAFSGVQCTGKTTLLNELEKLNLNYKVIKFVVRDLVKTKNIKVNQEGNEDTPTGASKSILESCQRARYPPSVLS